MGGILSRMASNRDIVSVGTGLCVGLLTNWLLRKVAVVQKPPIIVAPVIFDRGIVNRAQDIFRENPMLAVLSRPLFALNAVLTGIF